jgi:hypothetical protein
MEYLFIDFENIVPGTLAGPGDERKILLFVGDKQTKISLDLVESIFLTENKATLIRIHGSGKNAADFHIAYYLGLYSGADPKGTFRILSKDKGFDPLVGHLKTQKIDCERIEKIPKPTPPYAGAPATFEELCAHLDGLSEKMRPKKVDKLKHYIQHKFHASDALVDQLFSGLESKKRISTNGHKVTYLHATIE